MPTLTTMPPGMIGLACGEIARYSDFIPSIVGLQKPPGTLFKKTAGLGPAAPFNEIAQAFLDRKHLEWLFLTNDDNLCPSDAIYRLWARNKDVVSGLYFGRIQPFEPVLFDRKTVKDGRDWFWRHLMKPGDSGLIPAVAVGDGCLLIRRRVLETIPPPWWEYGVTMTDQCDHDVKFSQKVIEAGFGLYCDLDVRVDHIATFAVRPVRTTSGDWEAHLVQGDGRAIRMPVANVHPDEDAE